MAVNKKELFIEYLKSYYNELEITEILKKLEQNTNDNDFKFELDYNLDNLFKENVFTDTKIEELELSARSYNCLVKAGIKTLKQLILLDITQLVKIKNLGYKSIKEIKTKIHSLGLCFNDEIPINVKDYDEENSAVGISNTSKNEYNMINDENANIQKETDDLKISRLEYEKLLNDTNLDRNFVGKLSKYNIIKIKDVVKYSYNDIYNLDGVSALDMQTLVCLLDEYGIEFSDHNTYLNTNLLIKEEKQEKLQNEVPENNLIVEDSVPKKMTLEDATKALNEFKNKGLTNEQILTFLHDMLQKEEIDFGKFNKLIGVLGYKLIEQIRNMSIEEQKEYLNDKYTDILSKLVENKPEIITKEKQEEVFYENKYNEEINQMLQKSKQEVDYEKKPKTENENLYEDDEEDEFMRFYNNLRK